MTVKRADMGGGGWGEVEWEGWGWGEVEWEGGGWGEVQWEGWSGRTPYNKNAIGFDILLEHYHSHNSNITTQTVALLQSHTSTHSTWSMHCRRLQSHAS